MLRPSFVFFREKFYIFVQFTKYKKAIYKIIIIYK